MKIKNLIDEDFVNFKVPSMFISTTKCNFKCDKECGRVVCQNSALATAPIFDIEDKKIIKRYLDNDITEAIVIGGLEPFDTFDEMYSFIWRFRQMSSDTIVIYTGYYPHEIEDLLLRLQRETTESNIIVKFGRFIPNKPTRFSEVLGVELASDNQFAVNLRNIHNMDAWKRTAERTNNNE